jgi:hypothetical protein
MSWDELLSEWKELVEYAEERARAARPQRTRR